MVPNKLKSQLAEKCETTLNAVLTMIEVSSFTVDEEIKELYSLTERAAIFAGEVFEEFQDISCKKE